ncbi:MAG TPA: hypothetical protein VKB78_13005 [Pirellulales bacterium]|nr:hypothetical protein [Pirellulales bacterium]
MESVESRRQIADGDHRMCSKQRSRFKLLELRFPRAATNGLLRDKWRTPASYRRESLAVSAAVTHHGVRPLDDGEAESGCTTVRRNAAVADAP